MKKNRSSSPHIKTPIATQSSRKISIAAPPPPAFPSLLGVRCHHTTWAQVRLTTSAVQWWVARRKGSGVRHHHTTWAQVRLTTSAVQWWVARRKGSGVRHHHTHVGTGTAHNKCSAMVGGTEERFRGQAPPHYVGTGTAHNKCSAMVGGTEERFIE